MVKGHKGNSNIHSQSAYGSDSVKSFMALLSKLDDAIVFTLKSKASPNQSLSKRPKMIFGEYQYSNLLPYRLQATSKELVMHHYELNTKPAYYVPLTYQKDFDVFFGVLEKLLTNQNPYQIETTLTSLSLMLMVFDYKELKYYTYVALMSKIEDIINQIRNLKTPYERDGYKMVLATLLYKLSDTINIEPILKILDMQEYYQTLLNMMDFARIFYKYNQKLFDFSYIWLMRYFYEENAVDVRPMTLIHYLLLLQKPYDNWTEREKKFYLSLQYAFYHNSRVIEDSIRHTFETQYDAFHLMQHYPNLISESAFDFVDNLINISNNAFQLRRTLQSYQFKNSKTYKKFIEQLNDTLPIRRTTSSHNIALDINDFASLLLYSKEQIRDILTSKHLKMYLAAYEILGLDLFHNLSYDDIKQRNESILGAIVYYESIRAIAKKLEEISGIKGFAKDIESYLPQEVLSQLKSDNPDLYKDAKAFVKDTLGKWLEFPALNYRYFLSNELENSDIIKRHYIKFTSLFKDIKEYGIVIPLSSSSPKTKFYFNLTLGDLLKSNSRIKKHYTPKQLYIGAINRFYLPTFFSHTYNEVFLRYIKFTDDHLHIEGLGLPLPDSEIEVNIKPEIRYELTTLSEGYTKIKNKELVKKYLKYLLKYPDSGATQLEVLHYDIILKNLFLPEAKNDLFRNLMKTTIKLFLSKLDIKKINIQPSN